MSNRSLQATDREDARPANEPPPALAPRKFHASEDRMPSTWQCLLFTSHSRQRLEDSANETARTRRRIRAGKKIQDRSPAARAKQIPTRQSAPRAWKSAAMPLQD